MDRPLRSLPRIGLPAERQVLVLSEDATAVPEDRRGPNDTQTTIFLEREQGSHLRGGQETVSSHGEITRS
jgi:hypothetical protein